MARNRKSLSSFELQLEVEKAADELQNYENISDDFSDYSNSDSDPTYKQTDDTCSSESDNEPLAKRKKISNKENVTPTANVRKKYTSGFDPSHEDIGAACAGKSKSNYKPLSCKQNTFMKGKIKLLTDIPKYNTSAGPSCEQGHMAMEDESDSSLKQDQNFLTDTVELEENTSQATVWGPVTGNFATFELPYNLGIPEYLKNEMAGKNELSFFEMFVSEDVINMIVTQTNIYAEQQILSGIINETITKDSRLNSWKDTNYNEIRTFIADGTRLKAIIT
ncbi:uncharacterized protein LOC126735672 [Anthonomus grandis grandis]|uniref:uncharacterized protein LOC126735672 n=1 Tax=Anthonomus grandis grandis TaxID=2921223 RepID=UPI002165BC33|nr:uncharacterized protein LOC126735672 [Anthonomus grandis grandis]